MVHDLGEQPFQGIGRLTKSDFTKVPALFFESGAGVSTGAQLLRMVKVGLIPESEHRFRKNWSNPRE